MTVCAIKCPKCNEIIYSRAHHDFHYCHCKNAYVDGGFDYVRIGAKEGLDKIKVFHFEVNATKGELFSDWNNRKNKFGWAKEGE